MFYLFDNGKVLRELDVESVYKKFGSGYIAILEKAFKSWKGITSLTIMIADPDDSEERTRLTISEDPIVLENGPRP